MSTSIYLSNEAKRIIKLASSKLHGMEKRLFMAEVSQTFCNAKPRLTETEFGFCRNTVELGLHEKGTGFECVGHHEGKPRSEVCNPQLAIDIRALVDPEAQADPKLKNTFAYTRITAKAVRKKLIAEKGWSSEDLPQERAFNDILNRLGYKLRRVQKTKPQKKFLKQAPFLKM